MKKRGIKPVELLYLAKSFHAAELYYRIDGKKPVVISEYRKNLLRNDKVRKALKGFIRNRFAHYAPFIETVDEFIDAEERAVAAQQ